jgi:putative transposase
MIHRPRRVNTPELVALVRVVAVLHQGKLLERPVDITPESSISKTADVGSEVA